MVMRIFCLVLIVALANLPAAAGAQSAESTQISGLLDRAEGLVRVAIHEKGAARPVLEEADALLESASQRLSEPGLGAAERSELSQQLEAVRELADTLEELYRERFFGVFPLGRLALPTFLAEEGLLTTEQLYHPPDQAAAAIASNHLVGNLDRYGHPNVVVRSSPADRELEIVVAEVLGRTGGSKVWTRRSLLAALEPEDIAAWDRGALEAPVIHRIQTGLDIVDLLVVTIGRPFELEGWSARSLRGDYYLSGEVIQGSPLEASLAVDTEDFHYLGVARDRRDQLWPIGGVQLVLFVLALAWSAQLQWSLERPLMIFPRLAVGAAFFLFGRIFLVAALLLMKRIVPSATDLAIASWYWPCLLGVVAILGTGLVAWIGQAKLTDVIPGRRSERAVGSIFGLTALGASSYFVAPLFLLEGSRAYLTLLPFLIAGVSLAVMFGFAVRTGPPVPSYFALGPLLLAPVVGLGLFTVSPGGLWATVGATGLVAVGAAIRHRIALAHGTEEREPTAEEAAQADQDRLNRLTENLSRRK